MRPNPRLAIRFVVLAFLSAPDPALTQAPVVTEAGDPSIDSDTIYALATDPSDNPRDAAVFLLDDGIVALDAAGRGTRTYRQVVHVLRAQAVRTFAERRLRYAPDRQRLRLNWVRVLEPDGTVLSDGPTQMQESDVAADVSNPVYVQMKELRLSLGGVAPNTIVDVSYTIEETGAYLEGDFFTRWNVHADAPSPVLRSRFVLDVPTGVRPVITEANLDSEAEITERDGRTVMRWATQDVPQYRPEPFAPDTNSVHRHLLVSLPLDWNDIARWYHELASDRYEIDDGVRAEVARITSDAATRLDTLRAIHRWIAQDIRYVSVSLGIGGYQPRQPAETVASGFGDCKDKATLFIAVLRSLRYEAFPVLLNSNRAVVRPAHPSIRQFNHMIAAVRDGAGLTYADLTARWTPYGEIPFPAQGGHAIVVQPDGTALEVTLPRMGEADRNIEYEIVATVTDSGTMSGYMRERNTGQSFEARRSVFGEPLDSAREARIMTALLRILPGATGDSMTAFDGRDLYAPVAYTVHFSGAQGVARTGGVALFTFPFGVLQATNRIRAIESAGERLTSIEAEEVLRSPPPTSLRVDMRVTLPEGWRARVPDDIIVESEFGTYATQYSQEGRVLSIVRREASKTGVYPPERLPDVVAFFRAIAADENNRTIVIESVPGERRTRIPPRPRAPEPATDRSLR